MLSGASHWVYFLWCLSGGILVLVIARHCLWLTLGNLFGATPWSTVCGCLCLAWVKAGRTKLHMKRGFYQHHLGYRSAKVLRHPEICLYLPPFLGCLLCSVTGRVSGNSYVAWVCLPHPQSLQFSLSCTCPDLGRVKPPGLRSVGFLGPWSVGLACLPLGGGASQVHRKVRGINHP